MTGDDLRDFVNLKLFPYLHGFKKKATGLMAIGKPLPANALPWPPPHAMAYNGRC